MDDDDLSLWQYVTQSITPFKRKKALRRQEEPDTPTQETSSSGGWVLPVARTQAPSLSRPLVINDLSGLDKRNADKLRKGKYPIASKLDLHGMTQDAAFQATLHTLTHAYDRGKRCILVITGKGKEGEGVLKRMLPVWLNHPTIAPLIVAVCEAASSHGGSGAVYVLLKRQR